MKTKAVIGVLAGLIIIGLGYSFFRKKEPNYEKFVVQKRTVSEEVSVSGKVKSIEDVELSFEQTGKIFSIGAKVGDSVNTGQELLSLDISSLQAQARQASANIGSAKALLVQYEAALEREKAKLRELEAGTRLEELQIAEANLKSAEQSLVDAQKKLSVAREKAKVDLVNLYSSVPNTLAESYTKLDDALNQQIDALFLNDNSSPELTYQISNNNLDLSLRLGRIKATNNLRELKLELSDQNLGISETVSDFSLRSFYQKISITKDFLSDLYDSLDSTNGISSATVTTYKTSVNTARTNINTVLTSLSSLEQSIAAQKRTNETNIIAAETVVNSANQALLVSQKEYDLKKAGATVEQINAEKSQVKQAEANILSQKAQVAQTEAAFANIQVSISKMTIRAPFSGIITKQDGKIGQIVAPNTPLVTLMASSSFEVEANVSETDISKIREGYVASITLDAYGSDEVFRAVVYKIDPAETIIDGVAAYKITLRFVEQDQRIKSGMTADVVVVRERKENVLAVPTRALIYDKWIKKLKILSENGEVHDVNVETGLKGSDGYVEILSGLQEGETVILNYNSV